MRTIRTPIYLATVLWAVGAEQSRAQNWSSFNYPGSIQTQARGISGNSIVGNYITSFTPTVEHGYLKNGFGYSPINDPLAGIANGQGTVANGIASNGNIVGYYTNSAGVNFGFLYNGSTYAPLTDPSAGTFSGSGTFAYGISSTNGNIVGTYIDTASSYHGFLYNGTSYTTLTVPSESAAANQGTFAFGISNSNGDIVGYFVDPSNQEHGFLYNGSSYQTLDYPNSILTVALGISDTNIVGIYEDSNDQQHGFLFDGANWTALNYPGDGAGTQARGIDGNNIVGDYPTTLQSGFLLTVHEPSSMILTALGILGLIINWRRSDAWPTLPDALRTAILAIVDSVHYRHRRITSSPTMPRARSVIVEGSGTTA